MEQLLYQLFLLAFYDIIYIILGFWGYVYPISETNYFTFSCSSLPSAVLLPFRIR